MEMIKFNVTISDTKNWTREASNLEFTGYNVINIQRIGKDIFIYYKYKEEI